MCKHLQVSTSGYYEWRSRSPSPRQLANAALRAHIRQIHQASDATYGAPRVHAQLGHMGQRVNLKRVERLMRVMGLQGVSRRRGFVVTTKRNPDDRPAPDLARFLVSGSGDRRLQPQGRRLGLWDKDDGRLGDCRAQYGAAHQAPRTSHSPQRPRQSIHQRGLWQALRANEGPSIHGLTGRCV